MTGTRNKKSKNWNELSEHIVTALKGGDMRSAEEAFNELWKGAGKWLFYLARQSGLNHEESEDVVEETFIGFWTLILKGESLSSTGGLLQTLLKRRVDDFRRKRDGRTVSQVKDRSQALHESRESDGNSYDLEIYPDDALPGYEKIDDADFREAALNPILDAMVPTERNILILRHGLQLSVAETAVRLELTEDQVKKGTAKALMHAEKLARTQNHVLPEGARA